MLQACDSLKPGVAYPRVDQYNQLISGGFLVGPTHVPLSMRHNKISTVVVGTSIVYTVKQGTRNVVRAVFALVNFFAPCSRKPIEGPLGPFKATIGGPKAP
jgi:hypothetical protein